jgi:hypothetical protein
MGRPKKNNDGEQDAKLPKPKVWFIAKFEMWDDGEITHDLVEKVQGERGAPRAWRLEPFEFMTSVKARLAENKIKILQEICKGLSITEEEIKHYYASQSTPTKEPVLDENDEGEKEVNKSTNESIDGFDFDKDK